MAAVPDIMRTVSSLYCTALQYAACNVGRYRSHVCHPAVYGGYAVQGQKRIVGNIAGVICFTVLYFLLPPSIYAYIGIIGGIGVGLSAQYGWQAVFNTFGALAIAAESYGLKGAVSLRVIQNVFGVVFALVFCAVFYRIMSVKVSVKEKAV